MNKALKTRLDAQALIRTRRLLSASDADLAAMGPFSSETIAVIRARLRHLYGLLIAKGA